MLIMELNFKLYVFCVAKTPDKIPFWWFFVEKSPKHQNESASFYDM